LHQRRDRGAEEATIKGKGTILKKKLIRLKEREF